MTIQTEICPLCGEGNLHEAGRDRKVEHRGVVGFVHTKASVCDVCGCSQASPAQVRDNQRAITAFQKQAEGRLTGLEMREVRKKIGLTQAQAASMFGGGPNSFAKYEADDVTQSEAMDNLVRMALELPTARAWLQTKASVKNIKTAVGHIRAQQNYHFQIPVLHFAEAATPYINSLKALPLLGMHGLTTQVLASDGVLVMASATEAWAEDHAVSRQTRLYGVEENLQSFLSPKYSEEEYDRHTQR